MSNYIESDNIDWEQYADDSDARAKVLPASEFIDELVEQNKNPSGKPGVFLPWSHTHAHLKFRPGEMTIWSGINSHGKSLLLGQAVMGFMQQRQRCLVASFEMLPVNTIGRMVRQASQTDQYTERFARGWADWSDDYLWLYNQRGQTDADRVLAVCEYAHRELRMNHIVIDSMMKVVRGEDDYNGQKNLVDRLFAKAQDTGMHIHLVTHIKKGQDEHTMPNKFGVKGSGSITDQVDNLLIVWKNKKKIAARQAGEMTIDMERDPDAMVIVDKQRNAEGEDAEVSIRLWFHRPSTQYIGGPNMPPKDMMEFWV